MPRKTKTKQTVAITSDTGNDQNTKNTSLEATYTSSRRLIKRKSYDFEEIAPPPKLQRKCEKAGCYSTVPLCFVSVSDRCAGSGYTSRWNHMSCGEHFCNECFEHYYRSYKDGYSQFVQWKKRWSSNGKSEPTLKAFIADTLMPYWVQCTISNCRKWRQLPKDAALTPDFITHFQCRMVGQKKYSRSCSIAEDSRVAVVKEPWWIAYLPQPALLKNSPAAQFLRQYYPDGVGLSPTCKSCAVNTPVIELQISNPLLQPFYQPTEPRRAMCMRPDVMEPEEIAEFPEYSRERVMYLGVRNLVLALWSLNPKEWLTLDEVSKYLICQGLIRIRCIYEAEKILRLFTKRGIINFGLVQRPPTCSLFSKKFKDKVIIVGAGISGLSAARHLQNLGISVMILEGRHRLGGRIWDDDSLGVCVGKGAYIVTGVINNPFTFICEQAGVKMRLIKEHCDLFDEHGAIIPDTIDKRADFHFNSMLDAVAEWRKGQTNDMNLSDKLNEMHSSFMEESSIKFSQEKENVIQFHISNLEYACGSNLSHVSALHWDQNEIFPQFAGSHALLPGGYSNLISCLAKRLSIRLGHEVQSIDYSDDEVIVNTNKETFKAAKVIVTVPLAILQKGKINFVPPLPERKVWGLQGLGAGIIEKIGLQFPTRFWAKKVNGADLFGRVPSSPDERGYFSVFYDLTPQQDDSDKDTGPYILMTYVSGDAVNAIREKKDEEIINLCMEVLRSLFGNKKSKVPDPIAWFVTHWRSDPFAGMAYSFVQIGGSGEAYDALAEDINQKVYFAGESTNRQYPQTVTGAYLSGIREAAKIFDHLNSSVNNATSL